MPNSIANTGHSATTASIDSISLNALSTASPLVPNNIFTQAICNVPVASPSTSGMQLSRAEVVARTVHLRCLPPFMNQRILADVFDECGEYLRVRICGNAVTHQKWVYGFVEFSSINAAEKMITYCGMELPNGPGKPPLRLKCSPSKQPILDCMAYDANAVEGTPCGFGRGYLSERTLNDVLLVVGSGGGAATPSTAGGGAGSCSGASSGGGAGDYRMKAAANALTALTLRSMRKIAATGCGCGCSGVNCCACCHCWRGVPESTDTASGAGGEISQSGLVSESAVAACATDGTGGLVGLPDGYTAPGNAASPSGCCGCSGAPLPKPTATPSTFAGAQTPLGVAGRGGSLDIVQQLAATFEGLRRSVFSHEEPLDGSSILQRAESMALDVMCRACHLTSDAHIQEVLGMLTQLLDFLDSNAAVTGGAEQTASGDCTATVPQCVTQLKMLANLIGALLCLLRRSVVDAIPYVEAVLITFAHIPPSTLLLRARQRDKEVVVQEQCHAQKVRDFSLVGALRTVCGSVATAAASPAMDAPAASSALKERRPAQGGSLGVFVDDDVAGPLLEMVDEDENEDGGVNGTRCDESKMLHTETREGSLGNKDMERKDHDAVVLRDANSCVLRCSDASEAFLRSGGMGDLRRRDEAFSCYVLNVLVSVGLSMEEVHPTTARSAYALANTRAMEVLGEPSKLLTDCLAASPTGNPHLCATLFVETGRSGCGRDITFFPHHFFESLSTTQQNFRCTRGTDRFWRELPPNHIVSIFQALGPQSREGNSA
ncbi:hypothetical protein JKF63_03836 [Porcisia hertigi]|uniref:RRM domain-containing protein n=1 Tax=Porcisia hertigi TaxID=2761500 RepID=A0A836L573_9TRYP|nr:hypothetical protein JKF63_03836 [Porcisia hertigi]